MIHPVDANVSVGLKRLTEELNKEACPDYFIFFKKYDPAPILLKWQELALNYIRVNLMKSFVWTNCPVIRTDVLTPLSQNSEGFLEDVILSDQLKENRSSLIIKDSVTISSRRYEKDGVFKRFIGNLYIMILYRLKLKSIHELKVMYYGAEK